MSVLDDIISNILETPFEKFATATVENAKKRIIDVVGCSVAGAKVEAFPVILDLVRDWGGRAESVLLACPGVRVPAQNAAFANSILASAFDYDPLHPLVENRVYVGHISGTTIPAALAVAEQQALSGEELLVALIVGEDLVARTIDALDYKSSRGATTGWSAENSIAILGTAASAGRMYSLNAAQMRNALGIAVNQAGGSVQTLHEKSHCYKLNQGFGAKNGIVSAQLGRQGFAGLEDPLFGAYSYFALFSREYRAESLTRDLGKKFYADSVIKRYPSCLGNSAAISCALELVQKHAFEPADIDSATVRVFVKSGHDVLFKPFEVGDDPHMDANWNMAYNIANVLLRKCVKIEHVTPDFVRDPQALDLAGRVEAVKVSSPEYPKVELIVRLRNGQELVNRSDESDEDLPFRPLSMEAVKEKCRSNIAFGRGKVSPGVEQALRMLENLEDVRDIRVVTGLLG
ncbi:MAG: MmgE/PrpD family protein [Chloroflexi bacterium]|nr:MmgE/PrpD family protein [Chloroflexota bacterium]